jgi:hypothetical protein
MHCAGIDTGNVLLNICPQLQILVKNGRKEQELKVKVKVNFTLEQATKAQKWSRGISLHFL